ncbi:MAG: transketolase C-terminal domain-containing protein, partial [Clostridia bacterium]
LKEMLLWSSEQNGAIAIRYPKSIDIDYELPFCQKWNIVEAHNGRVKLLCVGNNFLSIAYDISNALRQMGITSDIICVTSVKPLDETYLNSVSNCLVVTLEENTIFGGFGSCVCQNFSTNSGVRVLPIAVEDKFVEHATIKQQFEITNLTVKEITSKILLALDK